MGSMEICEQDRQDMIRADFWAMQDVRGAVETLVRDCELMSDLGPKLTCGEVEALADILRACDKLNAADILMSSHAETDDDGDAHHGWPFCDACGDSLTFDDIQCADGLCWTCHQRENEETQANERQGDCGECDYPEKGEHFSSCRFHRDHAV